MVKWRWRDIPPSVEDRLSKDAVLHQTWDNQTASQFSERAWCGCETSLALTAPSIDHSGARKYTYLAVVETILKEQSWANGQTSFCILWVSFMIFSVLVPRDNGIGARSPRICLWPTSCLPCQHTVKTVNYIECYHLKHDQLFINCLSTIGIMLRPRSVLSRPAGC